MVSALPAGSFDKAKEQLTAKFGDSFRLAASYITQLQEAKLEP